MSYVFWACGGLLNIAAAVDTGSFGLQSTELIEQWLLMAYRV